MRPFIQSRNIILTTVLLAVLLSVGACGRDREEATSTPEAAAVAPTESAAATAAPTATTAEAAPSATQPDEKAPSAAALEPEARNGMYSAPPEMTIDPSKYYYATLKTDQGDIKLQLFADRAPKTVNNFVFLAREGYYNDTTFHRVLDGFMAQAGDPTGTGAGGPGYEFEDEFYPGLVFDRPGLLAMANRGPTTNGSQFFVTYGPTEWLNGMHTIFGEVVEGIDVLAKLTKRDPSAQPDLAGSTIYSVEIEEADSSVLPPPTPAPPTATPLPTPTPFAPSSMENSDRPLAQLSPEQRTDYFNTPPEMVIDPSLQYVATINTAKGELVMDLFADKAPTAVNNFVVLANLGFYDNMPITLVRPDDSIIFGVPANDPQNDAGYALEAEVGTDITTDVGAVTYMPFQSTPDGKVLSSSSQLIIALAQPPAEANAGFSFFGQIVDGLDVLQELAADDVVESVVISTK